MTQREIQKKLTEYFKEKFNLEISAQEAQVIADIVVNSEGFSYTSDISAIEAVINATCSALGQQKEGFTQKSRIKEKAEARMVCYFILREIGLSSKAIANYFKRDHTTILFAVARMNELLIINDRLISEKLFAVKKQLYLQP